MLPRFSRLMKSLWPLALVAGLLSAGPLVAQVSPDQQAALILNSARKAFNEHNYPFAISRFREYLQRFGGHKDAPAARYGLALTLIEGPQKNYVEARDLLQPLAGNKGLPDYPAIVYHLGLAVRGLGVEELKLASARPQEKAMRQNIARQRFEEAARHFAAAALAFAGRVKGGVPEKAKQLPADLEWAARARCDQAEMELRAGKLKEARATTSLFEDPVWAKSRYYKLGQYYRGYTSYLLKDYAGAEKALSLVDPFDDPVFGTHARYLLARTHHKAGERAEATLHYEAVLSDYAKNKKKATEELHRGDAARLTPAERARLEALANGPPPDHVGRAAFYLGVLQYEAGRYGEAAARFTEMIKANPRSPLVPEAQLRLGFCQVQLREYPQARQTLQPLADREPRLAGQALFWIAKAKLGAAPDPANRPAYENAVRDALDTFRKAADKTGQGGDPEARTRRGEILLETGDTLQMLRQYRDAAQTYRQVLNDKLLPTREAEVTYRLVTALHLARDFNEADDVAKRFAAAHPKSPLLAAVLFRQAENSYFRGLEAEKAGKREDFLKSLDETIKRYQEVVTRFPEFGQVNLARYGIGLAYYRKGNLDKAKEALEAIPQADRAGELAGVNYLLADCILRQTPTAVPDDALAAGKLEEQLKSADDLLEAFASGQPNDPRAADALLKLGLCRQRRAALLADPPERNKLLQSARAVYDRLLSPQYRAYAGQPQAFLERAKCIAQMGDVNGAINELRRFTNDPLQKTAIAPMGLIYLSTLLRHQNRAGEAADLLARARDRYEPELSKDPARAGWVSLLRYHHGLALRAVGRLSDARGVFELVMKQAPAGSPEAAEGALRYGQCLKDEGAKKLVTAAKLKAGGMANQLAEANRLHEEGLRDLQAAVKFLDERAQQLKGKEPAETRARMLYETAWAWRDLAGPEIETARAKLAKGTKPTAVPLSKVSVQPSEEKARTTYKTLIADFPDLPLTTEARFELAELYAQHDQNEQAIKLLTEGLDKEPAAALADKMRLRLGAALAARGDLKAALGQFEAVAQNPKSPLAPQAQYRAGECLLQTKQWSEAVKRLLLFRDNPQFQNVPGVSDRALLRLGHAFAHLGDWNQSRQALELLTQRFGASPWVHEARYGIGWAWQQQKNYDQAVNVYSQVTAGTLTETAAKAQLQIGLCRLAQKRYAEAANALLVVPFTYDYPEPSAVALLEAARAFQEMKQPAQARRLLRRVIRDHPETRWAESARERLGALKES
jgi:TolA-binding protein